jgi:predicted transcriptional regulator
MRLAVDLHDRQVRRLDRLARQQKRSRAAIVREAVEDYLAKHDRQAIEQSFGLWRNRNADGLAYQKQIRREW